MARREIDQRFCQLHDALATLRVRKEARDHIDQSVIHHGRLAVLLTAVRNEALPVLLNDLLRGRIGDQVLTCDLVLLAVSVAVLTIQTIGGATVLRMTIVAVVAYSLTTTRSQHTMPPGQVPSFAVLTIHLISLAIVVAVIAATAIALVVLRDKVALAVGIILGIPTRASFIHNLV